jgi:hypothetical protein
MYILVYEVYIYWKRHCPKPHIQKMLNHHAMSRNFQSTRRASCQCKCSSSATHDTEGRFTQGTPRPEACARSPSSYYLTPHAEPVHAQSTLLQCKGSEPQCSHPLSRWPLPQQTAPSLVSSPAQVCGVTEAQ